MESKSLKISVIGISYAQEDYIEITLKSVLSQNYQNLEYFLIDDSYPNKLTQPILKKYRKKYSRYFKWIDLSKTSQYRKLNYGLKNVSGEVVSSLNSDDILLNKSLCRVSSVFFKHPEVKWIVGRAKIINDENMEIRKWVTRWKNFWLSHFSYNVLLSLNPISHCAVFVRKEVLQEIGDFNEEYPLCADYEYWLRLVRKYPPYILNNYLAAFRIHESGQGVSKFSKQFRAEIEYAKRFTKNPFYLFLHWLNYISIVISYHFLRLIKK